MAGDDGAGGDRLAGEARVRARDGGRSWSDAQHASESSRMNRKHSAMSAAVALARNRGKAHRHHQGELRHEGAAGAAAKRVPLRVGACTS